MVHATDEYIVKKLSPFVNVLVQRQHRRIRLAKSRSEFIGEFTLDRVIGKGKCGFVRLAWPPNSNEPVSIKLFSRASIDDVLVERLTNELHILSELEHPHIVRIKEVIVDANYLGLIMDWAKNGDVFRYLTLNGPISEAQAQHWFSQLVWAVDELHSSCVVHRDIKPENLLIDEYNSLILTDFEMSESFQRHGFPYSEIPCGSPTYCPPEAILQTSGFDTCKADVWAMGVTLYAMVAGYLPFDDHEFFGTSKQEIARLYQNIQVKPLMVPSGFSAQLASLLHGMLAKNPDERLSLADVKRHPWLEEHANLWLCPDLCDTHHSRSRYGSIPSTSSLRTLSDKMADCMKQVRGPIIWDPCASYDLPRH